MKVDYSKKLKGFTEKLKKVPQIIAVFYTGSTARRSWDKYSDIDIEIIVSDKDYESIVKQLPKFLSMWGKIKLYNNYKASDQVYAFIGKDYAKVEINPIKESNFKPKWVLKDIRVGFDKEDIMTPVLKKSQKEKRPMLDHNEMVHFFLDTRSNFLYVARHYARGQKLSSASELNNIGGQLFDYLGKIKGMEGHENLRSAEKHLTKKEWNFLKASKCNSLNKREVKRAIKANWKYMKYLESLYEKKNGSKLNLKCNDNDILRRIDRTLEG